MFITVGTYSISYCLILHLNMSLVSNTDDDISKMDLLFIHGNKDEESVETPMEEWSSVEEEVRYITEKRRLFNRGEFLGPSREICTTYIPQSDSTVLRHPFYNYPALIDPGIKKALLKPEEHYKHPPDGQDLYMELCDKLNLAPIRMFYRSLMEQKADLKYYGLCNRMIRVIAIALRHNTNVKILDLTDNFMDDDASFHIGELLAENHCLVVLSLSGCQIKAIGLNRVLAGLRINSTLRVLNLNDNLLDDEGGIMLANAIIDGIDITRIALSNNNLGEATAIALANALIVARQDKCKICHWDLSKNKFFNATTTVKILNEISLKRILKSIDLSWNCLSEPKIGAAISELFRTCPKLKKIDISNNMFRDEETVLSIVKHLPKAMKLETFNLSGNPLTPADALTVLNKMTSPVLGITKLLFDNVRVTEPFIELREKVLQMKNREHTIITHGDVTKKNYVKGPDFREVVLKRTDFLGQKKKKKFDIAVWAMVKAFRENVDLVNSKDLPVMIAEAGLVMDEDLADSIGTAFVGKKTEKEKLVSLKLLAEYANRLWPDRKMPPQVPSRSTSRRSSKKSVKYAENK